MIIVNNFGVKKCLTLTPAMVDSAKSLVMVDEMISLRPEKHPAVIDLVNNGVAAR